MRLPMKCGLLGWGLVCAVGRLASAVYPCSDDTRVWHGAV